jgi:hypothetical protein
MQGRIGRAPRSDLAPAGHVPIRGEIHHHHRDHGAGQQPTVGVVVRGGQLQRVEM